VGQNATLFAKRDFSANFFSAQALYLPHIKKIVSIVSKVTIVTFQGNILYL
jgi:hypothetical protein